MCVSKFGLSIAIISLLIGCSHRVYEQPSDKYPFEAKMKELLGDDLQIVNSLSKSEVEISSFDLPKKTNEIDRVLKQLQRDGWVLKGKGIGVDTYCLGRNNKINIVVPISKGVYDYKGGQLNITDYSIDGISYSYNKWGLDMCE
ncbi:hypothetical protein GCM10025882_22220 [Acinetobacter gyllenbergii]|uniref:Lipoprotein n=1 Tax=Acinetobacter gyllenbergii CIP 110306 = MTCC 11365 TaxID=1217657 RepID=A0A829HC52_9GAMM|nr:hypothetical protein [Acinetobacter gyllenbergii]EPF71639.1 hypothetical protein F957_03825 [Acinetobacter gyllenbergii CIP 110306 = MTCC 11365]EPH31206.1 hypothetical protein L293_2356 [Acinetobacter gyllenbergii CIP 110306 = MTCC 11365]ESK48260.1 hypothetical protein F987_01745 [Acinetobacter gyllenbergii NIPH 230]GMA11797.1 hypothetical protein GCM10025882_22220 [Acinetobacter gyllenbergii]